MSVCSMLIHKVFVRGNFGKITPTKKSPRLLSLNLVDIGFLLYVLKCWYEIEKFHAGHSI